MKVTMKRYLICFAALAAAVSCNDRIGGEYPADCDPVEMVGIEAEVGTEPVTKATALDKNNPVGRYKTFVDGDQMVLNVIRRTENAINAFSYSDIVYNHELGGWTRDMDRGSTGVSTDAPEKIYWSDAAGKHTFIGYSVPQQAAGKVFDWNNKTVFEDVAGGIDTYYGSIGDPLDDGDIDHTTGEKIIYDDLLLTHDLEKVAEPGGSVALVTFRHALADVRVIVNIVGFSASSDAADTQTKVESMLLKDMLTMYKWRQQSSAAQSLEPRYDQASLDEIYGDGAVEYDQRKNVRMWIPEPEGHGVGVGKTFTFHALAVPSKEQDLQISFNVKYPDPMKPSQMIDKSYTAVLPGTVEFRAGHCTTININLNHSNELMTVGAEYLDWQFAENPDEGELRKNSTFLQTVSRSSVTTSNDAAATEEDATWLYVAAGGAVKDIYGNVGTKEKPYTICTADQLLSFAYEVKEGRDFKGQYVKLDANITMQPTPSTTDGGTIDWIEIGEEGRPFEGYFDAGVRLITCLKGGSFFHTIGEFAHIEQLVIDSSSGTITSTGGFAQVNKGIICAGKFQGTIDCPLTGTDKYVGGFVGENRGVIMASYHLGTINAGCNVGGIAGYNVGEIIASYTAGDQTAGTGCNNGGITGHQVVQGSQEWIENEGNRSVFGSKVDMCFYDRTILTPNYDDGEESIGLTTNEMQKYTFVGPRPSEVQSITEYTDDDLFVNSLNYSLYKWLNSEDNKRIIREAMGDEIGAMAEVHFINRYYAYQPANYPWAY